ncbi:hypothetical protein BCR37DRAFT_268197 [Protomyces lactucae-debilis]|uniref:VanZ-like domain-containing protein n=1 Tax=Protomyces lactucae-debilis TaxID=2754530 RepID=A0A1Y2FKG0_PROLT|nr:uncharacterized protein BCR37DRAFT_268197 [Protomyces lactucae-debilis]ORY84450.1 hypothetical protein BCR37DRAFT_268197 [Protomyces lactucae-debilis]
MQEIQLLGLKIRVVPAAIFAALVLFSGWAGLYINSGTIPVHDKAQHVTLFFLMALSLYWVLDVGKRKATQMTLVVMLAASVGSEFLQSVLTTRTFDPLDIGANVAGSIVAISLDSWYHGRMLERKRIAKYANVPLAGADEDQIGLEDVSGDDQVNTIAR